MSQNRIEQLIEELYEYIESCKPKGFSFNTTQVVVMKEEIYDILDQMKLKIPEEIKRCSRVVAQKDQIIASAEEKAERIVEEAKRQAEMLVQESEIMRQAYLQANEMLSMAGQKAESLCMEAQQQAELITNGALQYTDEMFSKIENVLAITYNETRQRNEDMLSILEENLRIVQENRRDLQENVAPSMEEMVENRQSYQSEEERQEELGMYQNDSISNN